MEEYKDTPFLLVAPHHQAGTKEQVVGLCKKMGVNYTVTAQGDVNGQNTLRLPIAFLFDHEGNCIEKGRSISEKTIARAVKAALAAPAATRQKAAADPLDGAEFEELTDQAARLRAGKDLGKLLAEMRALTATDEDAQMDARELEAMILLDALETRADHDLASAAAARELRPSNAIPAYESCAATWAGDEVGERAAAIGALLKADEAFAELVEADRELIRIEEALTLIEPCKEHVSADLKGCGACRKSSARALKTLFKANTALQRDHASTSIAARASDLLDAAGIELR